MCNRIVPQDAVTERLFIRSMAPIFGTGSQASIALHSCMI
jgi:hypothetical protein